MPLPIYSTVTVESVEYTQENNFLGQADIIGSLPRPTVESLSSEFDFYDDSVFAVGIHAVDQAIGSGNARNLDSLIGLKILEPGAYTDVDVPIFPAVAYPELTEIQSGQTFPPNPDGETEVRAAIWETLTPSGPDSDDFPDNSDDAPENPLDLIEPFAVSPPATISALDQNTALSPTDIERPVALAIEVENRSDEPIVELRIEEEYGGTVATVAGPPLPIAPDATQVLGDIVVVGENADFEIVALDGDGNQIDVDEIRASAGSPRPVFIGS